MLDSVEVRTYMRPAITVEQSKTVAEASQIILKHKISGLTVVDKDGALTGILSELDCLRAMVDAVYNGGVPGAALVQDVMTKDVESNRPNEDIVSVASSMLRQNHRRRPVVENGKLVGQLTCRQLLAAMEGFRKK